MDLLQHCRCGNVSEIDGILRLRRVSVGKAEIIGVRCQMKAALPYFVSRVRECRFRLYRPVFDGFRRALSYNGCRSTGANRSIRAKNKAGVAARPLQVEIRIARVIG